MNKETILIGIIAFLIGGIGGYTVDNVIVGNSAGSSCKMHSGDGGMSGMGEHRMPDGSMMNTTGGMGMMNGGGMGSMMDMMVASERAFIEGMIPHHQEAVDTAKEVIARGGTTQEVKTLVENIVTAQEAEIADMKTWYQNWYGVAYEDKGTYTPMMRELKNLSGKELDKAFLEDMIMHHMGAIMMARSVQSYIEHDEMEKLTQNVVQTQSNEISKMRQMLKNL